MKPQKFNTEFATIFEHAVRLSERVEADGIVVLLDGPTEWEQLKTVAKEKRVFVAADSEEELTGAAEAGLHQVVLKMDSRPVLEKIAQSLLKCIADESLNPNATVVAVYSNFGAGTLDTISHLRLNEHLGRLSARDLRQLETSVPLDTLKTTLDLAVEIGREGREGKPVGTMFVVGDTPRVLKVCHDAVLDPFKGYGRKERDIADPRTREAIKEIAQMDGAFVISPDGMVRKACQIVDASHANLTLSKGLGSRHWSAAAISKQTKAIAIVVSESTGTVRLFQNGEVMLRVEPFRRAMKWKDFDFEAPSDAPE